MNGARCFLCSTAFGSLFCHAASRKDIALFTDKQRGMLATDSISLASIESKRGNTSPPFVGKARLRMEVENLQPSLFNRNHHGLGSIFYAQAVENFLDVAFHGVLAEVEPGGDFATGETLGNKAQDDELLRTEPIW